ncbi:MAG: MBL fold metallo-hydrolase [Candidatus Omnitrophica bacterium]|nr:MBL fold metallo-hydrolase [Candidatus Omnitrophota bacterium]
MQLTDRVHVVGSGSMGFGLSHDLDSHVYLIDGGTELALVDAGAGLDLDRIVANIRKDGLDSAKLKYLLLTHAHADHAGGCRQWRDRFGVRLFASPQAARFIRAGDEAGISLSAAKAGGFYPADYHFRPCPVDSELREGDVIRVGDCELRALDTSGHCSGMLSYAMSIDTKTYLFSGDTLFHGGRILMTNVYDCDFQAYVLSLRKLAKLAVDVLLPGHLCVALGGGQGHIRKAVDFLDRMVLPPNIL